MYFFVTKKRDYSLQIRPWACIRFCTTSRRRSRRILRTVPAERRTISRTSTTCQPKAQSPTRSPTRCEVDPLRQTRGPPCARPSASQYDARSLRSLVFHERSQRRPQNIRRRQFDGRRNRPFARNLLTRQFKSLLIVSIETHRSRQGRNGENVFLRHDYILLQFHTLSRAIFRRNDSRATDHQKSGQPPQATTISKRGLSPRPRLVPSNKADSRSMRDPNTGGRPQA